MGTSMLRGAGAALFVAVIGLGSSAAMAVNVSLTPSSPLLGFMNWTDTRGLPGYNGSSAWGPADLRANFTGNVLKLEAAPIGDANDYWYAGGGAPGKAGAKIMDANVYVEDNALAGQSVTFSMNVLQNTFVNGYSSVAFIKEFAPDYSSFTQVTAPVTPGVFSITKSTAPGTHVQYGFETMGANVWPTDVASKGFATITQVPEPATLAAVGSLGALMLRRRRSI